MSGRPVVPPGAPRTDITGAERAAITGVLGELPGDLLLAVRDGRGHTFQRLEFVGDAVLELVIRFHAEVAGTSCPRCRGDADAVVTDAALARVAERAGLDRWLEWEPSAARRADLVEACAGAVWAARSWLALAEVADSLVHPLEPVTPAQVRHGWDGPAPRGTHRAREVLGASVIEVAAATTAFTGSDGDAGELTMLRNRSYASQLVVERAERAGWIPERPPATNHRELLERKDEVDRLLADRALAAGVEAAVRDARTVVG